MSNLNFASFRDGPGGNLARALRIDVSNAYNWDHFTELLAEYNAAGTLEERARWYAGVASKGEFALLLAFLFAADFGWLADELSAGRPFQRLDIGDRTYREAIAACILRRN